MEALPKILALRVEDCSPGVPPTIKPSKKLEFSDDCKEIFFIFSIEKWTLGVRKKSYKFFGGVYNTNRGFDGVHSVAYIQETENGTVRYYNDFMVRNVDWEDIRGYAKLLFYFEENPL